MKYPIMNKNTPFHNSGVRKSDHTTTSHSRNPGFVNTRNNSGKSFDELTALAQEAMGQGDRVLAETYYQHAEHILRLNNQAKETKSTSVADDRRNPSQATAIRINDFETLLENDLSKS